MIKKGMGTFKAGIHVTFTENRLVIFRPEEMPHQYQVRLCKVTFDMGEVTKIEPFLFDISITDLDVGDAMDLWRKSFKANLDLYNKMSEEALSKPLLKITLRDQEK